MKTKFFLIHLMAFLVMPLIRVKAQDNNFLAIMPDSTTRTIEELYLSEKDMTLYLNSLSEDSATSIKKSLIDGLQYYVSQFEGLKGTPMFGGTCEFDGIYYDTESRMLSWRVIFKEEINGEYFPIEKVWTDSSWEEAAKVMKEQFFSSTPPGFISVAKWINFKIAFTIRGKRSNVEKRYDFVF